MSKQNKPYLRLNLLREKLEEAIEDFFHSRDENCSYGKIKEHGNNRYRLEYSVDEKNEMLDFRFNQDETTTLDLSSGGISQFKIELADSIKESPICTHEKIKGFEKPYFVVNGVELGDVEDIIEMLLIDNRILLEKTYEIKGGNRWCLTSEEGQKVTVTHYAKSSKTLIQGKPLALFNEVYTTLILLLDVEDMSKVMEENLTMKTNDNTSKITIEESLVTYIPHAKEHIESKIQRMLYQSIFNLRVNMEMFEYSFLAFPALKALEGHLKYIMKEHSIKLEDQKFSMFKKNNSRRYELCEEHRKSLELETIQNMENAYNFYNLNRHSIFHWDNVELRGRDNTRMINNIGEARGIIHNVLEIIDDYYKK